MGGTDYQEDGHGWTRMNEMRFPNGSRIVGLPGSEETIRGFSAVTPLLVDEASRGGVGTDPGAGERVRADRAGVSGGGAADDGGAASN